MDSFTISIANVEPATGDLVQVYPPWVSAGAAIAAGALVRVPCDGVIHEITVFPDDAQGGILEVWDIAGELSGSNDVNTATAITNAYLVAEQARTPTRAKRIWYQEFKADPGLTTKKLSQRVKITRGLAVRWITAGVTTATKTCILNITSEGLYRKTEIQG